MKTKNSARNEKLRNLGALFALTAMAAAAGAQTPVMDIQMPVNPKIDGCLAPGGLVRITTSDEPGSANFWCGLPPQCLTVAPGAFNGTSHFCQITQYSRREPRGNPAGLPGRNSVRDPEDLTCEAGQLIGQRPVGGICPPVPPPPPPAPAPTVSGTAWFTTPVFAPGTALDLNWAGVNAVTANIVSCSGTYFWLPSNGRPATSSVNIGPVFDASFVCTVDFVGASGETARANAWGSSDGSLPPAPAPAVAPPPPPAPTPAPAPTPCPPGENWNAFLGVCEPFGAPVPPPPPAPPPVAAACPAVMTMVSSAWTHGLIPIPAGVQNQTYTLTSHWDTSYEIRVWTCMMGSWYQTDGSVSIYIDSSCTLNVDLFASRNPADYGPDPCNQRSQGG